MERRTAGEDFVRELVCHQNALTVFHVKDMEFPTDGAGVPRRQWQHVAVVYDRGNTAHLYLNGRRMASEHCGRSVLPGPVWIYIGYADLNEHHFWRGRLAHVAVDPRALDAERIQQHCLQQVDVDEE